MKSIVLAAAFLGGTTAMEAENSVTISTILDTDKTSSGRQIVVPPNASRIVVSKYEIPVGAKLPEHEHLFLRYGYVLAGTLTVTNSETGKTNTFNKTSSSRTSPSGTARATRAGSG